MTPVSQLRGPSREHLAWPFFDSRHGEYAAALDAFAAGLGDTHGGDVDETCRSLVRRLGAAGLLEASVAGNQPDAVIDSRLICLARETLAWHSGLADFAFAMQGLGTGAVAIAGSPELRALVLPKARRGDWVAAFALSEKEAGSDVAAMACSARREGDHYILDGEKTWISNGGIADVYTLFARTGEAPGARGISAFVVLPDDPGFSIADRIDVMAPHPLATLRFDLAGFRRRACWARRAKASRSRSRSRCARSISSARRSQLPRLALPAARWMRQWRMRGPGKCSAACWATSN